MRDYKVVTTNSHKTSSLTLLMLATSCVAFWFLNIYTMFNWGEGMVLQKLAVQSLAWLHTICLHRELLK
jgi:hypothetical protein